MLLGKLKETEEIILEARELKNIDNNLKDCNQINTILTKNKMIILNFSNSQNTLLNENPDYFESPDLEKIKDTLKELVEKINRGLFSDTNSLNFIFETIKAKDSGLRLKWKNYLVEDKKVYENIKTLECLRNLYIDKMELNKIIFSLSSYENKWPISPDILESLEEDLNQSKKKIKDLKLNQDIENFLRMVMNGTATISDLTEDILNWIKNNEFEELIKLKFS